MEVDAMTVRQMKHDIRGELSIVSMGIEILEASSSDSTESLEVIGMMKNSFRKLEEQILQLADIALDHVPTTDNAL